MIISAADIMVNLFHDASSISWMIMVVSIVLSVGFLFSLSRKKRHGLPLSPWRLPFIGNIHQLSSLPHKGLHSQSRKYGPLMLVYFASTPYFVISNSELAREVTQNHDYIFSNRGKTKATRLLFAGSEDLLFSTNSHFWRKARKLCVNELLSIKQTQSFRYILEEEVTDLVTKIRLSCHDGRTATDLSSSFFTLANNTISRVVLGQKCIEEGVGNNTMAQLVIQATELVTAFSFGDFIPILSLLDNLTGFNRKGVQTSQALHAFMDQVIHEHEVQRLTDDAQNERKDFVHIINEFQKSDTSIPHFTRENIRAILLVNLVQLLSSKHYIISDFGTLLVNILLGFDLQDMFLAGTDTSKATMEWTMAELAKHPRIMKRVQDEIRGIVGEQPKIYEHHITQMEYLQCVVKESLRLHSPFLLVRQTSAAVTIGGFKLPANSDILINSWAIHRDQNTWDNPMEFLPDRFLNKNMDYKGQDHKYIPFGAGRRSCPGAHFAITEVEYALANLLCWFNWEFPEGMTVDDLDMSETASQASHKKFPLCLVPVPKIN